MLNPIAPDLWSVDVSLPQPGGVVLPGRCLVVKGEDSGLTLISPVRMEEATAAEIDTLGEVRHIVAPNKLHYMAYAAARARWPGAQGWGAPGLAEKRPELRVDATLPVEVGAMPFGPALTPLFVAGAAALSETAFLHGPSGLLFLTDLAFHIREPANWQTSLLLSLVGANGALRQSRAVRFAMVSDKGALQAALRGLVDRGPTGVIPAHGEVILTDGAARLREAWAWILGA